MWDLKIGSIFICDPLKLKILRVNYDENGIQRYLCADKKKNLYLLTVYKDNKFDWILTKLDRKVTDETK